RESFPRRALPKDLVSGRRLRNRTDRPSFASLRRHVRQRHDRVLWHDQAVGDRPYAVPIADELSRGSAIRARDERGLDGGWLRGSDEAAAQRVMTVALPSFARVRSNAARIELRV